MRKTKPKPLLERMMWALRERQIDFGAYVTATRSEYNSMARYLLRRWAAPEWFTLEDAEQELYLETWRHIWGYQGADGRFIDYDPTRGVTLSRWVVYGSIASAKRALHKARGVTINGSPDKKPSQLETPASFLGEEMRSFIDGLLGEEAVAETTIGQVEETRIAATKALRVCTSKKERYAVLAIREAGSVDGASQVLYDNFDHRITLRLGSEDHAERFVMKHAGAVAQRMNRVATPTRVGADAE